MEVVISQPMYFPWIGFLEQIRLADVFVRYDDVQFSKGSFANRVQIKTPAGQQWITVPVQSFHLGTLIRDISTNETKDWRQVQLDRLHQSYRKTPYFREMLELAEKVLSTKSEKLHKISWKSVGELCRYFEIGDRCKFINVEDLGIAGSGSQRVLDIVKSVGGNTYITGHGAKNYLDHEQFEKEGVSVEYMDYKRLAYPQIHGEFTPYVSALDLVANCGRDGRKYICSKGESWRYFNDWVSTEQ